jgi:hypothetical protein
VTKTKMELFPTDFWGAPPPWGDKEGVYYTLKKQKHAEPGEFSTSEDRFQGGKLSEQVNLMVCGQKLNP